MYKKNHITEFDKHAKTYNLYAQIQKKVAKELVQKVNFEPKNILDLGSGTGEVYQNINWKIDSFIAVDSSRSMCELHPKSNNIKVVCDNFDAKSFKRIAQRYAPFDLLISSSSLQWAEDIDSTLRAYGQLGNKIAFSIFTNGTFKQLYKITGRKSFLPSVDTVVKSSKIFKNVKVQRKNYKVIFNDTHEMLKYIQKSGISGGNTVLNYKEIKYLLKNYPSNYLEFEITYLIN
ncbi:MAG: methyltransferase domain-containing protein [Campylobacteraceae bacterium]|nr:methyltransferase domain-containing protein [Campylobacteraceae bacterium]